MSEKDYISADNKLENVDKSDDTIDESLFEEELNELTGDKETTNKKSFFGGFFKKNNKKEENIETEADVQKENSVNETSDKANQEDNSNIFDDFDSDSSLLDEVNTLKKEKDRDTYFYFTKATGYIQTFFFLGLLLLLLIYSYIFIQNKEFVENKDNQLLGPFCSILLDDVEYDGAFCTSVSTLIKDYEDNLLDLKSEQSKKILQIIKKVYKIENFVKTKEVIFLKNKTDEKLKILAILEEFDNLKNSFDSVNKLRVQCRNITIDSLTGIVSMTCDSFSTGYEKGIRGFDGKKDGNSSVKGTSVSIANSFINYISLESKVFTVINKQKVFKEDQILGIDTGFTSKTSFTLKLEYNFK